MGIFNKTKKVTPQKYRAQPNKKNRKNVSKKIENGRTLQTKDNYLEGGKCKIIHPEHSNPKDLYRKVVVIDSNRNDELVIVKLGKSKGKELENYQSGESKYKPYVLTLDENGEPIIIDNKKFKKNARNENLSKYDVAEIKKDCFKNASKTLIKQNKKKAREVKKRG